MSFMSFSFPFFFLACFSCYLPQHQEWSTETKSFRYHRCCLISFARLWLNSKPPPSQMPAVHPSLFWAAPTLYASFTPRYATYYYTDLAMCLVICHCGCPTNSANKKLTLFLEWISLPFTMHRGLAPMTGF